jgi:Zn-dependent protease
MFFKVNSVKVSIAEYLYEGGIFLKPLVLLIAVFVKLLRIPIPGSTDIPPVRSLVPFQTTEEELPTDIVSTLTGLDAELQQSGFELTDALSINHTTSNTQYASLVYLSANGDCVAWLRDRRWPQLSRSSRFPRVTFYSRAQNGKVVMTTSADRDLLDPPDWDVEYKTRLPVAELLQAHRMHLSSALGAQRPQVAANALAVLEDVHHQFVEFQTGRGVFFEAETELEVTPAAVVEDDGAEVVSADSTSDDLTRDPVAAVVEQVRRLETNRTQWVTKLIVLLVSVAVFVGLGAAQWDLTLALMLVPILFVHELGHYIAMVVFGYKNVQMFYIPLLGAAVTGRHYHVAGWRKAVVSLAGPLPSIVLGFLLGVVGIFMESEWIINASILTLILNAFNLLPFLPLDGGWVAHVTLFARSQWLDLLFRIGTVVTLLGVSRLLGERILMFFGIAMAIGIPIVWKTIKATEIARQRTIPEPTDDQIPELAIRQLVSVVQEAGIPAQSDKQIAQAVVNVYESMMTKPPSWPATLGIWALHVGGVLLALIGFIGLTMASLLRDQYLEVPEFRPQYVDVGLAEGQFRLGSGPLPATDLLMWEYPDDESARGAFEQLRDTTGDSTARLGRLVLSSRTNEAGVRDVEDFEFDLDPLASEADYVIGLEREARADVRFSDAPPASRQRMFRPDLWGYPSLLVSLAEPQQAEQKKDAIL